jgi:hypothetical protein
MTAEEKKALFQKTREERAKEKVRQEQRKNSYVNQDYEEKIYTAFETNVPVVGRLLGEPLIVRSLPTSPKHVIHSPMVLDDSGKWCKITWSDDKNWFLYKVYNTVMSYNWNVEKRRREYLHQETHPEIFNRVAYNNKPKNNLEKGMAPQNYIVGNWIDRHDMEWHREHKHTKLISKKRTVSKDNKEFFEIGFPTTVYEQLMDDIVEHMGLFMDYDIIVTKLDKDPWYKIYHPELHAIQLKHEDFSGIAGLYNCEPLTEEEEGWEMYDLDKLFPVSSYYKIFTRLGNMVKMVDASFNKSFYTELEKLVELEAKEREKLKAEQVQNTPAPAPKPKPKPTPTSTSNTVEVEQPVKFTTRRVRSEATKAEDNTVVDYDSLIALGFEGIAKLSDAERSVIVGYTETEDGVKLKYNCSPEDIAECQECQCESPLTIETCCPKCGREF